MAEGWYRVGHDLPRYFSETVNDSFNAREIVNGDKTIKPDWANGQSIGALVQSYHIAFLNALDQAYAAATAPQTKTVTVIIIAPPGVHVDVQVQEED